VIEHIYNYASVSLSNKYKTFFNAWGGGDKVDLLVYHVCIEHSLMQGQRTHKVHMYIWTHWTFPSNIPNISHLSHSYYMCTLLLLHPSVTLIMWWKIKIQVICVRVHRVSTCRQPQSEHKLWTALTVCFI